MSVSTSDRRFKLKGGAAAIDEAMGLNHDIDSLNKYYQSWSPKYDEDVNEQGYVGPKILSELLLSSLLSQKVAFDSSDRSQVILDAGCGTGLLGRALKQIGYKNITGFDLSESMAAEARQTGAYIKVDSNIDIHRAGDSFEESSFDIVACCGTFTIGHIFPEAFLELIKLTRPGGILAISIRKSYFSVHDFGSYYMRLIDKGQIELVNSAVFAPYLFSEDAHYFLFKV